MENIENKETAQQKLNDFRDIVKSFSELLTAENQALIDYNLIAVSDMYEQKAKTVSLYRGLVAYFIKNQPVLQSLNDTERQEFKELSLNLDRLLKENDMLLKTRMETSQNVMDTIVNVAKMNNNSNATSYGAQGKYSPLDNNHNALAINRTL